MKYGDLLHLGHIHLHEQSEGELLEAFLVVDELAILLLHGLLHFLRCRRLIQYTIESADPTSPNNTEQRISSYVDMLCFMICELCPRLALGAFLEKGWLACLARLALPGWPACQLIAWPASLAG